MWTSEGRRNELPNRYRIQFPGLFRSRKHFFSRLRVSLSCENDCVRENLQRRKQGKVAKNKEVCKKTRSRERKENSKTNVGLRWSR